MQSFLWSLVAVAAGAVWAGCFGPEPLLVAPWLALAPFFLLLTSPFPARLALLWGFVYWLVSLSWIPPTLVTFGNLAPALGWTLFALLALYLALFPWLFALAVGRVWRRGPALAALLAGASVWVLLEWVRGWLFSGFPWNLTAYAWIATPGALESSAWIGAFGVSGLVVVANGGIALGVRRRDWRLAAWALLVPLVLLGTAWRWNVRADLEARDLDSRTSSAVGSETLPVRVLQPDIPNLSVWDADRNRADYEALIELSHHACDRPGALLIWPESAAWPRRLGRDAELDRDLAALAEKGCAVLLNTVRSGAAGELFNAATLIAPDGERTYYDKRHLVPWGEYVPLGDLLPVVDALARNAGEFTAGGELALLPVDGHRLGAAICYEVVFPDHVAESVRAGATALVSITNDDWYGPTAARWQHLRAARFRAAETRRTLLRAAITGVSAIVRPDGSIAQRALPGERRILSTELTARRGLTPYARFGRFLPALLFVVGGFVIFRSGRPHSGVGPEPPPAR
ncbi:MAG: apolipoprotein N-acyltransferase [Thermoanaerobaculia bacterium]|nr:apolipoprotein N-acyltransferase [Thermoanaerobaculia bacterium]